MKIVPINNRVLVKLIKNDLKTVSGILVPENKLEKSNHGTVIAVSNKNKFLKSEVKVGQNIIFNKFSGQTVKTDEDEYLLIKEEDILAILEI